MSYTLLSPEVVECLNKINTAFDNAKQNYALNGGIAVQAHIANAVITKTNGRIGDIYDIGGLKKIFRKTEDIDVVVTNKADALSAIYNSELKYWIQTDYKPRARGELITFGSRGKPRIDLWVGDNEFDKKMVESVNATEFVYRKKRLSVKLPLIEYLIALKLPLANEQRHAEDISKLKKFTDMGLIKIDKEMMEELVELRKESKELFNVWNKF